MVVDGKGNINDKLKNKEIVTENSVDNTLIEMGQNKDKAYTKEKDYKSINSYKPVGNLVYNQDMFKKLNDKLN